MEVIKPKAPPSPRVNFNLEPYDKPQSLQEFMDQVDEKALLENSLRQVLMKIEPHLDTKRRLFWVSNLENDVLPMR